MFAQWSGRRMAAESPPAMETAASRSGMPPAGNWLSPIMGTNRRSTRSPGRATASALPRPAAIIPSRSGMPPAAPGCSPIAGTAILSTVSPGRPTARGWPPGAWTIPCRSGMPALASCASPIAAIPMASWRLAGRPMGSALPPSVTTKRRRSGTPPAEPRSLPIAATAVLSSASPGLLIANACSLEDGITPRRSGMPAAEPRSLPIAATAITCRPLPGHRMACAPFRAAVIARRRSGRRRPEHQHHRPSVPFPGISGQDWLYYASNARCLEEMPGCQEWRVVMSRMLFAWRGAARHGAGWTGRLAGAILLALTLSLFAGISQAWAAPHLPAASATLSFTQPNYRGVIGGPPGTRVTVTGTFWKPYATVSLSLTLDPRSCAGAVAVNSYQASASGSFAARFNWPSAANKLAPYYACATEADKGTAFSHNTFTVLASSPASISFSTTMATAGDSVTVTGHNWLPEQQTVTIVVLPCNAICQEKPIANAEVVSGSDGTFSQSMTLLAGAASGVYYAQATNAGATLSAISAPLQVAGQTAPGGTPLPGSTAPTNATRTSSGTGTAQPPSQTQAALKDALLAAGLGLLALIALVGAITIFIVRGRRAETNAPATAKDGPGEPSSPAPARRAIWRTAGAPRPSAPAVQERPAGELLPQRGEQAMTGRNTMSIASASLPTVPGTSSGYPWEQPTTPDNTLRANAQTPIHRGTHQPLTRVPDTDTGQRAIPPQPPVDGQAGE